MPCSLQRPFHKAILVFERRPERRDPARDRKSQLSEERTRLSTKSLRMPAKVSDDEPKSERRSRTFCEG